MLKNIRKCWKKLIVTDKIMIPNLLVKSNSGYKYNNVIRPLLIKNNILAKKEGNFEILSIEGLNDFMKKLVSAYLNV